MSETAKGVVQSVFGPNDYGFFKIKLDGEWYGVGKSKPSCSKGDNVSFDWYLKDDKYRTIKGKITVTGKASSGGSSGQSSNSNLSKEEWAEKDRRAARGYAIRDAVEFIGVAQAAGALTFLDKAKPAEKFDLLLKAVGEVANGFVASVYADSKPAPSQAEQEQAGGEEETDEEME